MPFFNSTAIARAEYGASTRQLQIWFRGGRGPYTYFGVPEQIYVGLLTAPSKGRYFDRFIRDVYGH
jgi:hypothetical protein